MELESSKRMTFEKLLEEQRHRLNSVGKVSETYQQKSSTPPSPPNDVYLVDGDVSEHNLNEEFYRVFSKVRAKTNQQDNDNGNEDKSNSGNSHLLQQSTNIS